MVIVMGYLGVIEMDMKPQEGATFDCDEEIEEPVRLAVLLNEHRVSLNFKRYSNCRVRPASWEAGFVSQDQII